MQKGHENLRCHKLIRHVAIEMAGVLFDELMKDPNSWPSVMYKEYKNRVEGMTPKKFDFFFIQYAWPTMIDSAKQCLIKQLHDPNINEIIKEEIYEAICLDHTFGRGKVHTIVKDPRELN